MRVSKTEAAIRQLDIAINLFFENKDPISIHTLAGAARGIFQEKGLKDGKEPFICHVEKTYPEKGRAELLKALNEYQNWFKHGDRLNEEILETFKEEDNDFQLIIAVIDCFEVCDAWPISVQVFQAWFYKCHPSLAHPDLKEYSLFEGDEKLPEMTREGQKEKGFNILNKAKKNDELRNDPKTFLIS